jgi:membrane-bound metal-dependent hydrolase YbcI (DUF457 family)
MPTPIGHALAGVTAAWIADLVPGRRAWRSALSTAPWYQRAGDGLTLVCAALAASPDLDLFVHRHRTITHSIGAAIFVALVAAAMAARRSRPIVRVALMCMGAYLTHLVLDWMAADTYPPFGIQALWPFSQSWYISGWDLFRQTARLHPMAAGEITQNVKALALEILILGPVALGVWLVRVKALAGLPAEMPRRDHPPE